MRKKENPTQVITITAAERTVFANAADVYAEEVQGRTGAARCHPNDSFDFYEGARIALARAFGRDPFAKTANPKPESPNDRLDHPELGRGRWVKAEKGACGKPGDKILIRSPGMSGEKCKVGDILTILYTNPTLTGCFVDIPEWGEKFIADAEYSIWVPERAEQKEPDPIVPGFCVGDCVRTGTGVLAPECQNRPGVIMHMTRIGQDRISYGVTVIRADGIAVIQICTEDRDCPAPLTLLWREEK